MVPRHLFGMHHGSLVGSIYDASSRKNWKIKKALFKDAWASKVKISIHFILEHLHQFVALWTTNHDFHLEENAKDGIVWMHTSNEQYPPCGLCLCGTILQYFLLSHGALDMEGLAPPTVKFFAWLATQDRIGTADILAKRG